jgi:RHS repeat-associated protein
VTEQYGYDAASRLTSFTDSGNNVTHYGYDNANRLTSLTEPNNSVTSYTYNNDNNRLTTSYPNGVVETIGYDDSQRLTSIGAAKAGTQLTSFTYSYLNNGVDSSLRRSVTGMVSGLYTSETTTYGYDSLGRLTSASSPSANYQYAYDVNGNMCAKNTGTTISGFACSSAGTGVTSYGYNAANELTSINGSGTFTYDGNGNLTGSPSYSSLVYNAKNQTTSITPTGGTAFSLGYSGPTQTLRITAGSTSQINSSLLGLTADKTSSSTTYYTRESGGTLDEERLPIGNYYYLHDGIGSIVATTDANGNIADSYKYDPYGNTISSAGSVANAFRYASYYMDASTGLYKVGLRYYDASAGRWTQRDPVDSPLDEQGWNRYIYAGDDPINSVDPSGALFGSVLKYLELKYAAAESSYYYSKYYLAHFAIHHHLYIGASARRHLIAEEWSALRGDMEWDRVEHSLGDPRGVCDEDVFFKTHQIQIWLPGCHHVGRHRVFDIP